MIGFGVRPSDALADFGPAPPELVDGPRGPGVKSCIHTASPANAKTVRGVSPNVRYCKT